MIGWFDWLDTVHLPLSSLADVQSKASTLYTVACAIFRVLAMIFQYAVVKLFVTIRHLPCFPSVFPWKNLKVSSQNIAHLQELPKCLATAWQPLSKTIYEDVGRADGLRVTHDIILHPANGLCLAKSLVFLAEFLLTKEKDLLNRIVYTAQAITKEKDETIVELQALYDALMGIQGHVEVSEREFFLQILQRKQIQPDMTTHPELLVSLTTFLNLNDSYETLRQFVLDDLENQGIEINPDLYALILEIDTLWFLQKHAGYRKNDALHDAILQTIAQRLQIELIGSQRVDGKITNIKNQLQELAEGNYLIQFSQHSIGCIKSEDQLALFDPIEGLAVFDLVEQSTALLQLLNYYGNGDSIALRVVQFSII